MKPINLFDVVEVKAQLGDDASKTGSGPVSEYHHTLLLQLIAKELGVEPGDIQVEEAFMTMSVFRAYKDG